VNNRTHRFIAPIRTKGVYRIYVWDITNQPNPPKTRTLTYFSFANVATNLGSIGADKYEAYTNAIGDWDKDGDPDLFLAARAAPRPPRHPDRVLRNDGNGQFADVTAGVMPAAGTDDWRADRIWPSTSPRTASSTSSSPPTR